MCKFKDPGRQVVKEANTTLAFVNQGTENKRWEVLVQLYKTLVILQLEYCAHFWSSHDTKDLVTLEEFHHNLPWDGTLQLWEEIEKAGLFYPGAGEAGDGCDRSVKEYATQSFSR